MSDDLSPSTESAVEMETSRPRRRSAPRAKSRSRGSSFAWISSIFGLLGSIVSKIKSLLYVTLIVGGIILAVVVAYSYWSSKEIRVTYQSNLEKIANHIVFPNGETPRILLVDDPGKLPPYPFFKEAKKNDVVALFENASIIAIYRPSVDRLVSMSTFESSGAAPEAGTTIQAEE